MKMFTRTHTFWAMLDSCGPGISHSCFYIHSNVNSKCNQCPVRGRWAAPAWDRQFVKIYPVFTLSQESHRRKEKWRTSSHPIAFCGGVGGRWSWSWDGRQQEGQSFSPDTFPALTSRLAIKEKNIYTYKIDSSDFQDLSPSLSPLKTAIDGGGVPTWMS